MNGDGTRSVPAHGQGLWNRLCKDIVSDFSIEQLRLDRTLNVERQAPPRAAAWRLPHPGLILVLCLGAELYARAGSMIGAGRSRFSLGLVIAGAGVLWGVGSLVAPQAPLVTAVSRWSSRIGALLLRPSVGVVLLGAWCIGVLWSNATALGGAIVLTDDHSSFQYRLHILQQGFPHLRIYNPGFNAGYIEWTAQVGTPILYGLLFPFLAYFPLPVAYSYLVAGLLALLPLLMGWGARLFLLSPGQWWAVVLFTPVATAGQVFSLRHLIELGMLPYTVSTVMAVLFTAAVYNMARRGWRWENGGALLLSFCLGMWHLVFFLLIAPASLFLVVDRETRSAFWSPFAVRLAAVVLLPIALGVLAPWVLGAVDLHMVGRLFAAGEFNEYVFSILPFWLLLTAGLGLAGGWLAQDRLRARLWVATAAALALFMFGGAWFISGVEPWRFGAPLSLFLLFPAAVYAASLFSPENRDTRASIMVLVLLFGLLLAKQGSAYFFLLQPEPPETREVRRYIVEHVPPQGRVYVEDFQPIIGGRLAYAETHAFGGHLAYLQALTAREIIGEPYHTSGRRIDQAFRLTDFSRPEELRRYFRVYNITHLLLKHPDLIRWCAQFSFLKRAQQIGPFVFFETGHLPNRVIEGEGTVEARPNQLTVQTFSEGQPLTLSYHWLDGLVSEPPVPLNPVELFPGEFFIQLFPGKETRITLHYH